MNIVNSTCNQTNGGVDLNRNYGYKFGSGKSAGYECPNNADYRGPYEFSEPETRAFARFMTDRR
jgi:hypothetical protein